MRILTRTQYDAIVDIVTGQKRIIDQKEEEIQRLKKLVIRLNNLLEDRACLTYEVRKLGKELNIDFPNSSVHKEFKSPFDKLF